MRNRRSDSIAGFLAILILVSVIFVGAVVISSCKTMGCWVSERATDGISAGIQKVGGCTGTAAVHRDVGKWVGTWGLCKKFPEVAAGPIGMLVCPIAGAAVKSWASNFANQKLPKDWQCRPEANIGAVVDMLTSACIGLFPVNTESNDAQVLRPGQAR